MNLRITNIVFATVLVAVVVLPGMLAADEIAVTVYNSNLGVVSKTRTLDFEKGVGRLAFTDVPSMIDATSVQFEVLQGAGGISILEQNYAFDLVSPDKIYAKYVDKRVDLVDKEGNTYSGTLLAHDGGAATLMDDGGRIKIVSLANIAEVNFPVLPEGLITRPTLFWLYHADSQGERNCRVGYQTSGMNWSAEYVGVLNDDESRLDLSGWASITNNSGKTYRDARLKLIAGDISRAAPPTPRWAGAKTTVDMMAMESAAFEEKTFFEYHMYTLPRAATLADREIKQISLFDPARATINKVYRYLAGPGSKSVEVAIKFKNSEASGLGMPLPEGRIRMFKADADGMLVLLGEDRIKHTPKDEELKVQVGTAFDIVAEERTVSRSRISSKVEEHCFEIELRNHKTEPVTIEVEKQLYGFWEITQADREYRQKDANTVVFDVNVPAGETVILSLTVRFTSR